MTVKWAQQEQAGSHSQPGGQCPLRRATAAASRSERGEGGGAPREGCVAIIIGPAHGRALFAEGGGLAVATESPPPQCPGRPLTDERRVPVVKRT